MLSWHNKILVSATSISYPSFFFCTNVSFQKGEVSTYIPHQDFIRKGGSWLTCIAETEAFETFFQVIIIIFFLIRLFQKRSFPPLVASSFVVSNVQVNHLPKIALDFVCLYSCQLESHGNWNMLYFVKSIALNYCAFTWIECSEWELPWSLTHIQCSQPAEPVHLHPLWGQQVLSEDSGMKSS